MKTVSAKYDRTRRVTTFNFLDEERGRWAEDRRMRGGVAWPMLVRGTNGPEVFGFAVMSGQDIKTGKIYIMDYTEFRSVDYILDADGLIKRIDGQPIPALGTWLTKCWSKYSGNYFYYRQDDETSRRYQLEILRSDMIQPKPVFVDAPWPDDQDAVMTIWQAIQNKKIIFGKKEANPIFDQLQLLKAGDTEPHPVIHALKCMLIGIERYPYRERSEP